MSENVLIEILASSLYLIIKVSAPMLVTSLVIGLVLSILQTVTSIQEQTLTFVPKLIGVFLSIVIFGKWIMVNVVEYMQMLMQNMNDFIS